MMKDDDFAKLTEAARKREAAQGALRAAEKAKKSEDEIARLKAALAEAGQVHEKLQTPLITERGESNLRFAARHEDFASSYEATPALRTAVRVALTLGRPLLLTGEPGTGKTLSAFWIARLFADGSVLRYQVKSESRAKDLLYSFDAASWFRKSQIEGALVGKDEFLEKQALGEAFGWQEAARQSPAVVLIDEIDKAPRDFPNDLLHELDQMSFRIDETGDVVECPPDKRPIVVITSNSERQLPPPFLRRCVVHMIALDPGTVLKILQARLASWGIAAGDQELLPAARDFWAGLSGTALERKPTIDEYWRWLALEIGHGRVDAAGLGKALTQRKMDKLSFVGTLLSASDIKSMFPEEKPV